MKRRLTRTLEMVTVPIIFCLILAACSSDLVAPDNTEHSDESILGRSNVSTNERMLPHLSYGMAPTVGSTPSGPKPMIGLPQAKQAAAHQHDSSMMKRAP
jgi:hypothetical protein